MFVQTCFLLLMFTAVSIAQLKFSNPKPWESELSEEDGFRTAAANDQPGTCTKEYSCVDCYKAQLCVASQNGFRPLAVVNCNDTSTTTPYCTDASGTCTTMPPIACAPAGNFTCVRDGTFPDPTDCTRYYVCLNSIPYAYKCDRPSLNYDSSREACASAVTCYTFNCRGKHGVKIAYGKTANIFAYCVNGSAYVVDRCPGNYELNADTQKCEPVCSSEGNIPDVARCNKYYKCVKRDAYSSSYTITSEECPQSYGFDSRSLRCVPISLLKDCQI